MGIYWGKIVVNLSCQEHQDLISYVKKQASWGSAVNRGWMSFTWGYMIKKKLF